MKADEICCKLNDLTGNDWKPKVYGEFPDRKKID